MKKSCFPDCWKISLVVPVFKNVWKKCTAKSYHSVRYFSVIFKVWKIWKKWTCWSPREIWSFSDFQYGFRSSRSTADSLTHLSDRIARAFNRSGTTHAVSVDIFKAFYSVWHVGLLHKLMFYGIPGQMLDLISSFISHSSGSES